MMAVTRVDMKVAKSVSMTVEKKAEKRGKR